MLTRNILISLVVATICISAITADTKSAVLEYNDSQFFYQLRNHPIALVVFYAPWCHYSQDLLPELDTASDYVSFLPTVKVIKVDCWTTGQGPATCNAQGVKGYPTMKIFKNGVFYKDYNGERKSFSIINELFNVYNGAA